MIFSNSKISECKFDLLNCFREFLKLKSLRANTSTLLRNLSPKLFLYLKFYILKSKKSDINEHLGVLSKYASKCESVFETGVRGVVSSWALLHGLSKNNESFTSS